ncbi:hypothetical protein BaOVIS_023080 [Babesia ovis]|uniref:Uncharacterized protein n=1 Tax=Babesia ovis TaxID=5869 RepID=A0A9W5TB21_BABOV|nr:hypothetical protein BaOVIS_023080 [Babesia ovis]
MSMLEVIPNRISSPLAWNGHLEGRTSPPLLFRKVTKCSLPLRSVGSDVADNKEPFAGCSELLHNSSIWSDNALDLSFEDMAAREVDIHNYESRSLGQVRRLGAVVASALIVGAIYGTLTIIRSFLNQQQAKLRADRYGSSGVYSETSTDTETFR